jgi:hypothetical protein
LRREAPRPIQDDTPTISATTGGTVTLTLDFPDEAALHEYKVLISKTGTGPSFYGVDIPLTRDRFLNDAFLGNYPFPTHTDLHLGLAD